MRRAAEWTARVDHRADIGILASHVQTIVSARPAWPKFGRDGDRRDHFFAGGRRRVFAGRQGMRNQDGGGVMRVKWLRTIICDLLLAEFSTFAASAEQVPPDHPRDSCRDWNAFSDSETASMRAGVAGSVHFFYNINDCRAETGKDCSGIAREISKDTIVLLAHEQDSYRCVYAFDEQGSGGGWVPLDQLRSLKLVELANGTDWIGRESGRG